ncbi:MAG: hypothetical protein SVY53_03865 [Chloroflexota bacterium]|nr:hypothetical protein [Chloroflexota bacterium]
MGILLLDMKVHYLDNLAMCLSAADFIWPDDWIRSDFGMLPDIRAIMRSCLTGNGLFKLLRQFTLD